MEYGSCLSYIDLRDWLLRSLLLFGVSLRVLSSFDNSIIFDKKKYKCRIESEFNINKKKELKMEFCIGNILKRTGRGVYHVIIVGLPTNDIDSSDQKTGYKVTAWDDTKKHIPFGGQSSHILAKNMLTKFREVTGHYQGVPPREKKFKN